MKLNNKQLTSWALSFAVALTASVAFAQTSGSNPPDALPAVKTPPNPNSNAGTTAGSNAGTKTGSNAGTSTGSNAGTNTGSNATNTNANNNTRSNQTTVPGQTNAVVPRQNSGTTVVIPPGGQATTNIGPASDNPNFNNTNNNVNPNATNTTTTTTNTNNRPANGTTPVPTGPMTTDGSLKNANVPPPSTFSTPEGARATAASKQITLEGQLVDLYSASQDRGTTTSTTPAVSAPATSGTDVRNRAQSDPVVVMDPPKKTNTPANNAVESTGSVARTGTTGDSFGTYSRPGATIAPNTPAASTAVKTPDTSTTADTTTAKSTTTTANFDNATITKQLNAGVPAAVMANDQMYILVIDGKQLSQYAGQNIRVTGKVSTGGALIPDRIEARQSGADFREITLTKPSADRPATATDR